MLLMYPPLILTTCLGGDTDLSELFCTDINLMDSSAYIFFRDFKKAFDSVRLKNKVSKHKEIKFNMCIGLPF